MIISKIVTKQINKISIEESKDNIKLSIDDFSHDFSNKVSNYLNIFESENNILIGLNFEVLFLDKNKPNKLLHSNEFQNFINQIFSIHNNFLLVFEQELVMINSKAEVLDSSETFEDVIISVEEVKDKLKVNLFNGVSLNLDISNLKKIDEN